MTNHNVIAKEQSDCGNLKHNVIAIMSLRTKCGNLKMIEIPTNTSVLGMTIGYVIAKYCLQYCGNLEQQKSRLFSSDGERPKKG